MSFLIKSLSIINLILFLSLITGTILLIYLILKKEKETNEYKGKLVENVVQSKDTNKFVKEENITSDKDKEILDESHEKGVQAMNETKDDIKEETET